MYKMIIGGLLGTLLFTSSVWASNCASYTYTLANGTTADASQVMTDFNDILGCANSSLAPIASPNFTGNVGINTSTPSTLFDVGGTYYTTNQQVIRMSPVVRSSDSSHSGAYFLDMEPSLQPQSGYSASSQYGLYLNPAVNNSSISLNALIATASQVQLGSTYTGTVTSGYAFRALPPTYTNSPFTNYYSLYVDTGSNGNGTTAGTINNYGIRTASPSASAGLGGIINNYDSYLTLGTGSGAGTTNNYGLYISGNGGTGGAGTTNNFSLYNNSTATSYFAGNVGIGTTSPSYTLHVNGSVAGTSAYNNLSDARLKKDIVPIHDALALVTQLRGIRFRWRPLDERAVGKTFNLPVAAPQVGFIAQEVKKVLPEAVSVANGPDAIMSVAESKIVPVLVEAIKELKATNDNQATEIRKLETQMATLQRKLSVRTAEK